MRMSFVLFTALILASQAVAQSYSHNYESFFGKEDRIGLYSEEASKRFSPSILKIIQDNTLLMDCGTNGKPSTAFITKTKGGPHIISAAHNLTMAEIRNEDCKLGTTALPYGRASQDFKDSGTKEDAAYDIAQWPSITSHTGFDICESMDTSSKYILAQSLGGTGKLGISPICKVTSIEGNLLITTCRGHYKASGAPLLVISKNSVCVAGVFNAHSGKQFGYESYAAKMKPEF